MKVNKEELSKLLELRDFVASHFQVKEIYKPFPGSPLKEALVTFETITHEEWEKFNQLLISSRLF